MFIHLKKTFSYTYGRPYWLLSVCHLFMTKSVPIKLQIYSEKRKTKSSSTLYEINITRNKNKLSKDTLLVFLFSYNKEYCIGKEK